MKVFRTSVISLRYVPYLHMGGGKAEDKAHCSMDTAAVVIPTFPLHVALAAEKADAHTSGKT